MKEEEEEQVGGQTDEEEESGRLGGLRGSSEKNRRPAGNGKGKRRGCGPVASAIPLAA